VDDDERTDPARWCEDALRRAYERTFYALRKVRRAQQRLFDTEDRMGRADDDYQRTVLAGAHLPPRLSTLRVTARIVRLDRTP
jgi:hypothetical protein